MVAVTVDRSGGRNQETLFGLQRTDKRECKDCHDRSGLQASLKRRSMYEGVDVSGLTNTQSSAMTWVFLKRLRDTTKMKIVLKGILAHEDAVLCVGRPYVWGLGACARSCSRSAHLRSRTSSRRWCAGRSRNAAA